MIFFAWTQESSIDGYRTAPGGQAPSLSSHRTVPSPPPTTPPPEGKLKKNSVKLRLLRNPGLFYLKPCWYQASATVGPAPQILLKSSRVFIFSVLHTSSTLPQQTSGQISVADPGCLSRIPDPDFYPFRIPTSPCWTHVSTYYYDCNA